MALSNCIQLAFFFQILFYFPLGLNYSQNSSDSTILKGRKGVLASVLFENHRAEKIILRWNWIVSSFRGKIARAIKFGLLNFLKLYFIVISFAKNIRCWIFRSRQTKATRQEGSVCDKQLNFIVQMSSLTASKWWWSSEQTQMSSSENSIGSARTGNDSHKYFTLGDVYWVKKYVHLSCYPCQWRFEVCIFDYYVI